MRSLTLRIDRLGVPMLLLYSFGIPALAHAVIHNLKVRGQLESEPAATSLASPEMNARA